MTYIAASLGVLLLTLAAAIAWGGPGNPPPLPSINDPFKGLDFSDLPKPVRYSARDGTALAYRIYPATPNALAKGIGSDFAPPSANAETATATATATAAASRGSVVLVHGSSAHGSSLHVMAKAFAAAGYDAFTLDIRGHGLSGSKGQIAYIGQLEDDLEDWVQAVKPVGPRTLVGFSSGGGFVLRVAGSARQTLFAHYLLLSPFISPEAPTYRPHSGGWVSVGVPRLLAVSALNAVGVHAFDHLPVTRFALNDAAKAQLTPTYGFALAQNFRPQRDYRATLRAVRQPMRVLVGDDDEAFRADQFEGVFKELGLQAPVTRLPGINHIGLTLNAAALEAAVLAVQRLREGAR